MHEAMNYLFITSSHRGHTIMNITNTMGTWVPVCQRSLQAKASLYPFGDKYHSAAHVVRILSVRKNTSL